MSGSRRWCFTVFNYNHATVDDFIRAERHDCVRYVVWQCEKCPTSGRSHIQGYVELHRPIRLRQLKQILDDTGAHCEAAKGPRDACREYCQKEESRCCGWWESGEWIGGQGSRSDLSAVHAAIQDGASLREISNAHFDAFVKYSRGIKEYILLNADRRMWPMEVWVLYGDTETGKTRAVYEMAPDVYSLAPSHSNGVGWWQMYEGHADVLLDDFYGWLRYSFLLQLLDRYPLRVESKGGVVQFVGRRIFITSNAHPNQWYPNVKDTAAMFRRFTRIYHCDKSRFWREK
ncbi:replication-associated protein [Farfantepenaeus duorarum circovirus]|uniref:replication-associated protein n=1 Tax=Farfantepenaeus duorarum circovirus TaxID=1380894 RepID=UPI0003874D55|nr:replication-associated protein [Farfantepenaeus duorarum circovirus]AGS47835.1 replication-associated protein [Farfantepenaeus duorarum circovirus]